MRIIKPQVQKKRKRYAAQRAFGFGRLTMAVSSPTEAKSRNTSRDSSTWGKIYSLSTTASTSYSLPIIHMGFKKTWTRTVSDSSSERSIQSKEEAERQGHYFVQQSIDAVTVKNCVRT
mmetsp:Transcript_12776/g.20892  ORF Transcript_12776/g.20892 Transcript_12776/m.20892 type:complete len:118 (-) Transcript_12776:773-1126(-)